MVTEKELRRHHTIKYKLNLMNSSLAEVARSLSLSPNTVHSVSSSRSKSFRVAKKLSEVTQIPFEELFPEYLETTTRGQS